MTTNNGGPAFPHQDWDPIIQSQRREHGMSLRDWFAGQALTGMNASEQNTNQMAAWAYEVADAMIAYRKPKK